MSDLTQKLKALAEFDETRAKDDCKRRIEAFGKNADLFQLHVEAARFEHHHLQPLHAALFECVEALEQIKKSNHGVYCDLADGAAAASALAKLQALVEGK